MLRAGSVTTRPFAIGPDVWKGTIWKALNFFYGNRCGFAVPGVHPVDHLDGFAVHGRDTVSMSGGWHDAGDLSQGVINTGEGAYSMFALAERLDSLGRYPALVERLLEEATWGLHWQRHRQHLCRGSAASHHAILGRPLRRRPPRRSWYPFAS